MFITDLAQDAGDTLDFSCVTRERMSQASIAGNEKNTPDMMQRLFNEISDPVRVAALRKAIASLEQHGFAWNNHYNATTLANKLLNRFTPIKLGPVFFRKPNHPRHPLPI